MSLARVVVDTVRNRGRTMKQPARLAGSNGPSLSYSLGKTGGSAETAKNDDLSLEMKVSVAKNASWYNFDKLDFRRLQMEKRLVLNIVSHLFVYYFIFRPNKLFMYICFFTAVFFF